MDNTYEYFIYDRVHTPFHCLEDHHVVNIFSFSKAYGMMGWRMGYIAYIDQQQVSQQPPQTQHSQQTAAASALTVELESDTGQITTLTTHTIAHEPNTNAYRISVAHQEEPPTASTTTSTASTTSTTSTTTSTCWSLERQLLKCQGINKARYGDFRSLTSYPHLTRGLALTLACISAPSSSPSLSPSSSLSLSLSLRLSLSLSLSDTIPICPTIISQHVALGALVDAGPGKLHLFGA